MELEVKAWLYDILTEIEDIQLFIRPGMTYRQFVTDRLVRKGVEKSIEMIGEAVNKLLRRVPDIPISHARRIVQTRNKLSHEYYKVDYGIVWLIIERDLPVLKSEVKALLG